jgi:hypothetical protein
MRKTTLILLSAALVVALVAVLAGCGGSTTTTTSVSATTSSSATTGTSGTTGTTTAGGLGQLAVPMSGDQVAPPVQTSGSGTLTLGLDPSAGITYKLDVQGLTGVTSAGLYLGAKGQNGEMVVSLLPQAPPAGAASGTIAQGTITSANLVGSLKGKQITDVITALLGSGGGVYAQVNTQAHPNGEIRGQIDLTGAGAATGSTAAGAGSSTSSS